MATDPEYFAPIGDAKYIQLTTYRRDGRAVATPVHVVAAGNSAFFRTWDVSGKAKRIRHTPMVMVAPSSVRGRPYEAPLRAQATLLQGLESERAAGLLAKKHPILHGWLFPKLYRLRGWTTQQSASLHHRRLTTDDLLRTISSRLVTGGDQWV